ncbi:MAG: MFS transporter [Chloroflexota bacterium]|nr:MFS transporter [Chloroflexota bacterium]
MRHSLVDGVIRYSTLLRNPRSRLLIGASTLSDLGDWMNIVALTVLAYRFGDGILAVGVMLALRKIPGLLLQIPAGSLIDRVQGPRLLIVSQLLLAVVACSFSLLTAFPNLWLLYGLVTALEMINVVTFPAFRTAVAKWTPDEQRASANALLSLENTLAWLIGPIIGGVMLAWTSASVLFVVNGLTYVVIALAVTRVWMSGQPSGNAIAQNLDPKPGSDTTHHGSVDPDVAIPSGYRMLLRRPDVLGFGLMTIVSTMIVHGAIVIFVLRAIALGFGEEGLGVFYAATAVGAIIGGVISGLGTYMTRSVLLMVAAMEAFNAIGFGLFAVVPQPLLVLVILTLIGVASEIAETSALTYFQQSLPVEVYGRFFSLFLTAVKIGGLIGILLVPWLGQRIGPANALLVLASTGTVVAVAYGLAVHIWIRREVSSAVRRLMRLVAW